MLVVARGEECVTGMAYARVMRVNASSDTHSLMYVH